MATATVRASGNGFNTALQTASYNDLIGVGGMTIAQVRDRANQRFATAADHLQQPAVNAGGSGTSMLTGTLASTPTVGNILVAFIRRADNNAVTNPDASWSTLGAGGVAGSRSLHIAAKEVGAAEPTSFTFTTAAGAVGWRITLMELRGYWRVVTPLTSRFLGGATANVASNTTFQQLSPTIATGERHALFIGGFANASTISNPTVGTPLTQIDSTANLDPTSTQGGCALLIPGANQAALSAWQWSWTTARAVTQAQVTLISVGGAQTNSNSINTVLLFGAGAAAAVYASEAIVSFDLSGITAPITAAVLYTHSNATGSRSWEGRAYLLGTGASPHATTGVKIGAALTALAQIAHFPAGRNMSAGIGEGTAWDTDSEMVSALVPGAVNHVLLASDQLEDESAPTSTAFQIHTGIDATASFRPTLVVSYGLPGSFFRCMGYARR